MPPQSHYFNSNVPTCNGGKIYVNKLAGSSHSGALLAVTGSSQCRSSLGGNGDAVVAAARKDNREDR